MLLAGIVDKAKLFPVRLARLQWDGRPKASSRGHWARKPRPHTDADDIGDGINGHAVKPIEGFVADIARADRGNLTRPAPCISAEVEAAAAAAGRPRAEAQSMIAARDWLAKLERKRRDNGEKSTWEREKNADCEHVGTAM